MTTQTICPQCGTALTLDEEAQIRDGCCPRCGQPLVPERADPSPDVPAAPRTFLLYGINLQPGWKTFVLVQVAAVLLCLLLSLLTGKVGEAAYGMPAARFFAYLLLGVTAICSLWYVVLALYTLFAKPPALPDWMEGMAATFHDSREHLRGQDGYFAKYYGRPMLFLLDGAMRITAGAREPHQRTALRIILGQLAFGLGLFVWYVVASVSLFLAVLLIIIWIWATHDSWGKSSPQSSGGGGRQPRDDGGLPPGRQPGGTSKSERDWLTGQPKVVHRDKQGNVTAVTQNETEWLTGNNVQVTRDQQGNVTGNTRNENDWLTGQPQQVHRDADDRVTSTTTRESELITGQGVDVHRNTDGQVTGKSTDEKDWLTGEDYTKHQGS